MMEDSKKILKMGILGIFFLFIIIYAFFTSKDLIFGVKIKNLNIKDGLLVHDSVLKISGNAKNAVNLTLNGREIPIDQTGNFNETISLLLGYNIIDLHARDKFGNADEKIYKLIYQKNI